MMELGILEKETLEIFEYDKVSEFIKDTFEDKKLGAYLIIADVFHKNKDVLESIEYFSSVLTGKDNSNLKNLMRYIRELDEDEEKNNVIR